MQTENQLRNQLEQLTKEKESIQKIINHDIRAPFNRIHALISLLKLDEHELSHNQQDLIHKMEMELAGGLELITNLNGLRELDNGHFKIDFDKMDLVRLIQKALRQNETAILIKKIEVEFQNDLTELVIQSDEFYLHRILLNMISNAVKFSPTGGKVVISLTTDDNRWYFTVSDSGPGITQQEAEKLYQRFTKLSSIPSAGEATTGLGLYLARTYADAMKLDLKLENAGQAYARFTLSGSL